MKPYLKLVFKRYLIILFTLSFFCIALSPHTQNANAKSIGPIIFSLFLYRLNILSIFSLVFAVLTTLQTYEKENITVALSMSGMHSFKILKHILFFSFLISMCCLVLNQFFLTNSIKTLHREKCLCEQDKKLHVKKIDNSYLFYTNNFENITYIDSDKNITYAKHGKLSNESIILYYVDYFQKKNNLYEKIHSKKTDLLNIEIDTFKNSLDIKNSAPISSLYNNFIKAKKQDSPYKNKIANLFFYRLLLPFLHLFAVGLAGIFGFNQFFRSKPYLSLFLCLLSSLYFFFLLECTSILADGNILSPFYFVTIALCLSVLFPSTLYIKKV